MTGDGIVVSLTNIEPIDGADAIVQSKTLGETLVVSKDYEEGELGLLFDIETVLSPEFAKANNLFRHSELNSDTSKAGFFDDNPRVRPIRLRGVKATGFFAKLDALSFAGDISTLKEGDKFTEFNGIPICKKYVPQGKVKGENKNQSKKIRENLVPTFAEHFSTEHLLKSLGDFNDGDRFVVTTKNHGTSGRYAYLPVIKELNWIQKLIDRFIPVVKTEYKNVVGSRKVLKSIDGVEKDGVQHWYDGDIWSRVAHETFKDNLIKGESIYFEICGFTEGGTPIMPSVSTDKLKNFLEKAEYKAFKEAYGDRVVWSYGCEGRQSDVFVYRITQTNEDGDAVDLSWDQVKLRCEKLGVKHVEEIARGIVRKIEIVDDRDNQELLYENKKGEKFYKKLDTHLEFHGFSEVKWEELLEFLSNNYQPTETKFDNPKEGVCLRVEGYPKCKIYKYKNTAFRVLDNVLKDTGESDIEEQESE